MKAWPLYVAAAAAVALFLVLRGPAEKPSETDAPASSRPAAAGLDSVFWTTPGLEPDTCVAAWLLTRVVSPGARVVIAESHERGTPFDVPGTELGREPGKSVSDLTIQRYAIRDEFAVAVAGVARELELNPWTTNDDPFFSRVRTGLADALNAPGSDLDCLGRAMEYLDSLRASPVLPVAEPRAPTVPAIP